MQRCGRKQPSTENAVTAQCFFGELRANHWLPLCVSTAHLSARCVTALGAAPHNHTRTVKAPRKAVKGSERQHTIVVVVVLSFSINNLPFLVNNTPQIFIKSNTTRVLVLLS